MCKRKTFCNSEFESMCRRTVSIVCGLFFALHIIIHLVAGILLYQDSDCLPYVLW